MGMNWIGPTDRDMQPTCWIKPFRQGPMACVRVRACVYLSIYMYMACANTVWPFVASGWQDLVFGMWCRQQGRSQVQGAGGVDSQLLKACLLVDVFSVSFFLITLDAFPRLKPCKDEERSGFSVIKLITFFFLSFFLLCVWNRRYEQLLRGNHLRKNF